MADRPNIVICFCDQLRAHSVGCYGNDEVRTPNIDRLAAEGTRFEHAITPNPVCTPARSALLAGQYSRTCAGMLGNTQEDPPNPKRVRLGEPTLPERLREVGYRTALVGKWHIDPHPRLLGFEQAVFPLVPHRNYGQTYFDEAGRSFVVEEFGPDFELAQARKFLSDCAADGEPFFLYHNISLPHQPIGPDHMPARYHNLYDPDALTLRPNTEVDGEPAHSQWWFSVYNSADFFWREQRGEEQDPADVVAEDFTLRDLTAMYYAAATCTDDYLGLLLQALEERGLADNTTVVFASDHGDNLGSHGLFNKNRLIEEAIRIPLIVRTPGEDAKVISDPVSLVDVAPTLLSLAGAEPAEAMQGQDLAGAIRGEGGSLRDAAFIETGRELGIRTRDHLLGIPYDAEEREASAEVTKFFDLRADPYEERNLAQTGEEPDLRESLRRRLLAWDAETPWM